MCDLFGKFDFNITTKNQPTKVLHNAVMSSEYERAQNLLPDDDILRCQINGNEVDFIFDDLYDLINNKLSEAKKGQKHPNWGKHFSEETKSKMSEAHKGEKAYWYGKHLTDEAKKKISEAWFFTAFSNN